MNIEQKQMFLTEEEKTSLIQSTWVDHKGRLSGKGRYAIYVALDSPRPDFYKITNLMFGELSKEENLLEAEHWARFWGKVVVCVAPGGNLDCILADVDDDKNKSFLPVSTAVKLPATEFFGGFPQGELATVLINNKLSTVEAVVISYVHLIDELIWDIYQSNNQLSKTAINYRKAVNLVKDKGFSMIPAKEEDILLAKKMDPLVSIRIYGSGVNKDVPKVMGGIIRK